MARIGAIVGVLLLLGVGVAVAATLKNDTGTWRYKMTVEVNTPEGLKAGYAVREVTIKRLSGRLNPMMAGFRTDVKGEAVVVNLGKRGKVFALLSSPALGPDYAYQVVFHAFPMPGKPPGDGGATPKGLDYYSHLKGETVLPPYLYPMFVTFGDLNDPKTVKNLYEVKADMHPAKSKLEVDKFAETFGKGVALKDVRIEMTQEPVTRNINNILPWLITRAEKHIQGYLGGDSTPPFADPTNTYLNGSEF